LATQKLLTDKHLEILHDHYKETFARIRDVEQSRDRLFLWLIGLFALLCLEIGYPAAVGGSLGTISIVGGEINLNALPLPALLNITWALTLVTALQYCRTAVWVNRQYPYLHLLEETISPELGGGNLYKREGKVYLSEYPLLLDVAWFAYGFLFPSIVMCAAVVLAIWEYKYLLYPLLHILFDIFMVGTLIFFFSLYLVQPYLASLWKKWKTWLSNKQAASQTATPPGQEQPKQ